MITMLLPKILFQMVGKILSKIVLVLLHWTAINPSNSFSIYTFQTCEEGKFCNWYILCWDERIFVSELWLTQFLMHRLLWQELGLYCWTWFYSEVYKSGEVPLKVSCSLRPVNGILSYILNCGENWLLQVLQWLLLLSPSLSVSMQWFCCRMA